MSRPTLYTPELANQICERLAGGEYLRTICRTEQFPSESTVRYWAKANQEGFSTQYARAREAGLDSLVDLLLEIAGDGSNDWVEVRDKSGKCTGWRLNHEAISRSQL